MKLNKVRYYVNTRKRQVIAVVYHGGQRFEGIATCGPEDRFDQAIGEEIAAAKALAARDRARALAAQTAAEGYQSEVNRLLGQARSLRTQARKRLDTVCAKYSTFDRAPAGPAPEAPAPAFATWLIADFGMPVAVFRGTRDEMSSWIHARAQDGESHSATRLPEVSAACPRIPDDE